MKRLVLDIETSGTPFDDLDTETQEYLLKRADTPEKITQVKEQLSLLPLTGEIVAIGVLDVDAQTGVVHFQAPGRRIDPFEEEGIRYEPRSERECLEQFWAMCAAADQVITFSGRGFDAPWLMLRSLVHGVRVTKNLMPNRYGTEQHLDLADQLTFYGATRGYSLDFWCKTLGITSPKTDVKGKDVPQLFLAGEYERIARYNARDLRATRELFLKWQAAMPVAARR